MSTFVNVKKILYTFCTETLLLMSFYNFSDFVESISYGTSKSCQVRGSNPCRGASQARTEQVRGQELRSWDKLSRVFDQCSTLQSW